jgi:lipopolysaccharide export system permease protein
VEKNEKQRSMNVLDKYLIKKFLFNLIFASIAFVIFFLVIDLIENLDKFIDRNIKLPAILLYYCYYVPNLVSLTLPVSMLLACLFALGSMSQHNEIVAQKSAGISLYRIFLPLFITAFFISIFAGLFNELLVPATNQKRLDMYRYDIKKYPRNRGSKRNNIYLQDLKERKVSIGFFNGNKNEALKVSFQYFDGPNLIRRIDVKKMVWAGNNWLLQEVVERNIQGSLETVTNYAELNLPDIQFKPESLLELQKQPEEMSFLELKEFIADMKKIGGEIRKWVVELHLKISYPFANFIIILFGAPIAAQKRRSGTAVGVGISLLVCFIYFLFIRTGQVMGHQGTLNPWLGAWFGNILFGVAGFYTLIRVRK